MQFIEELTLIHKVAIVATIGLIMVLLVSARRRKAAAAPSEASPAPAVKASRRRGRAKDDSLLPRRKRRKLAAEAAHAMGIEASAATAFTHEPAAISVPEVPAAPANEPSLDQVFESAPVAEPMAAVPTPVAVSDDPYLHDGLMGDAGGFVAQPGWPSPGELASSFDPDAFDPLPEIHEPPPEVRYDEADAAVEYDDTHAIELPTLSTAHEVTALAEIEEWADTVEAGAEWDDTDDDADSAAGNWTISEPQHATDVTDGFAPIALEDIWTEPDDEPLWDQTEDVEVIAEDVVDLATALKNDPVFDSPEPDHVAYTAEADDVEFDAPVSAWADDSPGAWQTTDAPRVSALPAANPSAWNGAFGGQNSPVVLDLAGLAASGQSLELLIEPNADGHGMRLRFGVPSPAPAPVAAVSAEVIDGAEALSDPAETTSAPDSAVPAPHTDVFDVLFLAGTAPVDERSGTVSDIEPIAMAAPATPEYMVVETPDVAEAFVSPEPEQAVSEPAVTFVDHVRAATFETSADDNDQFAYDTEPAGQNTASAVMGHDDDPARILADIRARLAALDAQR